MHGDTGAPVLLPTFEEFLTEAHESRKRLRRATPLIKPDLDVIHENIASHYLTPKAEAAVKFLLGDQTPRRTTIRPTTTGLPDACLETWRRFQKADRGNLGKGVRWYATPTF